MKTITIVCDLGIFTDCLVNFIPNIHMPKLILATGDISRPKTAIKLAKKAGNLNHFKSIIIKLSIKNTLQIMASLAKNANTEFLKICFMGYNSLQDKKITEKGFLVVGLSL